MLPTLSLGNVDASNRNWKFYALEGLVLIVMATAAIGLWISLHAASVASSSQ